MKSNALECVGRAIHSTVETDVIFLLILYAYLNICFNLVGSAKPIQNLQNDFQNENDRILLLKKIITIRPASNTSSVFGVRLYRFLCSISDIVIYIHGIFFFINFVRTF